MIQDTIDKIFEKEIKHEEKTIKFLDKDINQWVYKNQLPDNTEALLI